MAGVTTKSEQIKAIIEDRYPCSVMPYGAQLAIANEVGATRELVRQIANKVGATPIRTHAVRYICAVCGGPMKRQTAKGYCRDCATVEIPCHGCGKPVRRLASLIASRAKRAQQETDGIASKYTGRVFCSRSCTGRWQARNFGWGTAYQESMSDAERAELRAHA